MVILLCLLIFTICGCGTNSEKSVTGDFAMIESRGLAHVTAPADSITVGSSFRMEIGTLSNTLAGRYGNSEAFSVVKFSSKKVSTDNVIGAQLIFDVDQVWKDGDASFELYETHSDWSDSIRLESESFITGIGSPLDAVSDTALAFTTLTFNLDPEIIRNWSDNLSFLIKSSDSGMTMISLLSDDTSYPPTLKLFKQKSTGDTDTTKVTSVEGTYYFNTGFDDGKHEISEGDASGYVLHIGIPGSVPALATINRCVLKMTTYERMIPENPMAVVISRLKSPFTTYDEIDKDTSNTIQLKIEPDTETYDMDITAIINAWHIGGSSNYGLTVEPVYRANSPNQCIIVPGDSLEITYTPFPEVK